MKGIVNHSKPAGSAKSTSAKNEITNIDYYLIALGLVIVCISLIRFRLINIPLERDEGEYAYFGKQILDGIAPYKEAYNLKLPGTYGMYALIMGLFGKNVFGIHLGLLLINAATTVFFFLGFRKIFNSSIALFTASVYGIMSVSPTVYGFAAHATQCVTFFVSLGIFFLARYYENKKLLSTFLVGLMFGLSFIMKQQAVFFIVFGGLAVILLEVLQKPLILKSFLFEGVIYSLGAVLPYIITVVILTFAGAFNNFWFWTVEYAGKHVSEISFSDGLQLFTYAFKPIWQEFTFFWIACFAGIVIIYFTNYSVKQKLLTVLFTLFAFLTICPGFYFRQHYFVSLLPAIGLLGAIALDTATSYLNRLLKYKLINLLPVAVLFLVFITAISKNVNYYLKSKPNEICRSIYGSNPFVESIEIADYIKKNSTLTDKVAILGSEPQILFYADRNSATGYIHTYGLLELHDDNIKMQQQMISEIERSNPKFLVLCDIQDSWLPQNGSPMLIFNWFDSYSSRNYELSGVVEMIPYYQTSYLWDKEVKPYQARGMDKTQVFKMPRILIYKRKLNS